MAKAYRDLEQEGLVEGRQGVGTFVVRRPDGPPPLVQAQLSRALPREPRGRHERSRHGPRARQAVREAQLIGAAPEESAVALSFKIFALEAGIAIGSALSGIIVSTRHPDALPYTGAVFTLIALLAAVGVERRARQRRTPAG